MSRNTTPEKTSTAKRGSRKPTKAEVKATLKQELTDKLSTAFSVQPEQATHEHIYNALVLVLRDRMRTHRVDYIRRTHKQDAKQVYYMSMEFLMGRSLKNTLFNLNLTEAAAAVVKEMGLTWLLTFPGCGLIGFLMAKVFMWIFG